MSRTQFRAKSGPVFVINEMGATKKTLEPAASGNTHATMPMAGGESWFWLVDGTGMAGKGCGSDEGFAWQQGILLPCWQHTGTGDFAQHADNGVCASRNGVPASTKLQMMANTSLIVSSVTSFGRFSQINFVFCVSFFVFAFA